MTSTAVTSRRSSCSINTTMSRSLHLVDNSMTDLMETYDRLSGEATRLKEMQKSCRMRTMEMMKKLKDTQKTFNTNNHLKHCTCNEQYCQLARALDELQKMLHTIPGPNSPFVHLTLGHLNVTFGTNEELKEFKRNSERLERVIGILIAGLCFILCWISLRMFDVTLLLFVFIFYYSLLLRESIMQQNGAWIHSWSFFHHILTMAVCICSTAGLQSNRYDDARSVAMSLVVIAGVAGIVNCVLKSLGFLASSLLPHFCTIVWELCLSWFLLEVCIQDQTRCEMEVVVTAVLLVILAVGNAWRLSVALRRKCRARTLIVQQ